MVRRIATAYSSLCHFAYTRNVIRPVFHKADLEKEEWTGQFGQDKWVAENLLAGIAGCTEIMEISGYAERLSGIVENYDVRHLKRIELELDQHGGRRRMIEVPCQTLNELLESHNISTVEYLDIDTEGSELSILSAVDWNRFDIKVIGVENNYRDYRIPQLLMRHGYKFHSVVGDEFYIKNCLINVKDSSGPMGREL
ncbi:MAG: FkbM family methyltransferase [Bacteroidetes bacterium]|nr:FkbM family methyltransferase [Bacteroidota bacterium]